MSRRILVVLASVFLLGAALAQAAPDRQWIWTLSDHASEVSFEASDAAVSKGDEALVVKASGDFDPDALEIDTSGTLRREKVGSKTLARVSRPDWARDLVTVTRRLTPGKKVEVPATADPDGRVRLAVGLEKDSAVTVTIRDERGAAIRSFTASSTVPVRWRADLGSAAELTGARLELRADRGAVVSRVNDKKGMRLMTAAAVVCSGSFSQNINYSGSLTYTVSGCPASTCAELTTYRNGSWLYAANYLCTDASGNKTLGPWYWSNTPSDQTDDPLYFRFPNNDTTDNTWHIWDKNPAVTYRDSAWGSPPTAYSGHATDTQWGAGFDFGGACFSDFVDVTPNPDQWWDPATGSYNSTSYKSLNNTITRVDRWYVQWTGSFPSSGSHTSGHTYYWTTCCHDGNSGYCTSDSFTKP
jgi:hypothetical protein